MYAAFAVGVSGAFPQNYDTEVESDMMVFNTLYGFTRWSAYSALCFWRLRLKISRNSA